MDVTPLIGENKKIVQSYAPGRFKVSGQTYEQSIFVLPDEVLKWSASSSAARTLTTDDFSQLLDRADDIDVVFLGCGKTMDMLPAAVKQAFKDKHITIEPMDTGAACRTYNVLMAEGRRIVAALLK